MRDPDLKDWLQKHPVSSQIAVGKYCHQEIKFHQRVDISKHGRTSNHQQTIAAAKQMGTFVDVLIEGPSMSRRVTEAELTVSLFIAESNVAIDQVNNVVRLAKKIAPDPKVYDSIELADDKCSKMICNVHYKLAFAKKVEILNEFKFSVSVDESTDVSMNKILCVCVRYFDREIGRVVQHLLHTQKKVRL